MQIKFPSPTHGWIENTRVLALLGADDPEMKEIEKTLARRGIEFRYATVSGARCHPGNAYGADVPDVSGKLVLILIECEPTSIPEGVEVIKIDHHRQGDPGFGLPPVKHWEASSIGQLYTLLRMALDNSDPLRISAVDHCPRAAMRGECAGFWVSAPQARELRREQIAEANNLSVGEVNSLVDEFVDAIRHTTGISLHGKVSAIDLRHLEVGAGYNPRYLCLQQALMETGSDAIFHHADREGGPRKVLVNGDEAAVAAFKDVWAPAQGLARIYGDPSRGYAGGYLPE